MSIKLRKPAHDRFSKVVGWLCLFGWVGGIVFTGYTGVTKYLLAHSVLEDHVVIPATLEFVRTSESHTRRAGVRQTFHYRYTFEVEGEAYEGNIAVSESNIDAFRQRDSVDVAFSMTNRTFERLSIVERTDGLLGMIGSSLMFIFIMSILVLILYAYLTVQLFALHPDDQHLEDDAEGDEAKAAAQA